MEHIFYKAFIKELEKSLCFIGAKVIKQTRFCIILRSHFDEDIIIPKKQDYGYVRIFFCKDKRIDYIYENLGIYKRNQFKDFFKFYNKRQKQLLARHLNETSI